MELTKTSNSWLNIELSIENRNDKEISFLVKFINNDKVAHEFEFSNKSAKAEFMCLSIIDENEELLNPQRRQIPRLKNQKPDRHQIKSGDYWLFCLDGELLDGWLEFMGAAYQLKQGEVYLFSFEYMGIVSNKCKLIG